MPNLSGKQWWLENQHLYPNSSNVDDLSPAFKAKVVPFISALRTAGATVKVAATLRHPIRAHLMHYCWQVANGMNPKDVPAVQGLDIEWDHGNPHDTIVAAQEMVDLFGIKFPASLTSNHIKGLAIDMNITWTGPMSLQLPGGGMRTIGAPLNGADNSALHDVGNLFGVKKLLTDRPHWSVDGH